MALPRAEKAYEKHAWIFLFASGITFLIFAITALSFGFGVGGFPGGIPGGPEGVRNLTGLTWDELLTRSPATLIVIRAIQRVFGIIILGLGIFTLAIARVSYRKGERWAWYVLWYLPAFFTGLAVHELGGGFVQVPVLLLIISLLGLLLPYGKFFPRKQV